MHNRRKQHKEDEARRETIRSALKQIHNELKDTVDEIEKGECIHYYDDPENPPPISFLKMRFYHMACESLITSSEVRSTNLDVNEIKKIIGIIKENNRIFDWMEHNLPLANEDGSALRVEDDEFPNMLEDSKKMHSYQEHLRADIPPMLEKIRKACDLLD